MRVKTATDDQGLEIIQGDRAAFSIRKNSVMELLKNGGSAPFSPEYIEFEIEKKKKQNSSVKDVLEFRGDIYTRSEAIIDSEVIFKFNY